MSISVDTVYQKVLALANKEQRGYITPQEFNLFADHAQMDIFEQYFYDLEQRQRTTGNDFDYADIITNIEEKISFFEVYDQSVSATSGTDGMFKLSSQISDLYRLGMVRVQYGEEVNRKVVEQIQLKELNKYSESPLGAWTKSRPIYVMHSGHDSSRITVYPHPDLSDTLYVSYTRRPKSPNWTYFIHNQSAVFNPDATAGWQDFELHPSEESNLVVKILQLAGVSIKDLNLVNMASQEEIKNIQQEKQ